jgi:hypothetical protein
MLFTVAENIIRVFNPLVLLCLANDPQWVQCLPVLKRYRVVALWINPFFIKPEGEPRNERKHDKIG